MVKCWEQAVVTLGSCKTQCVHRKRNRPFVRHKSIEDIEEDTSRHYSEFDATDDQLKFNDSLPDQYQTLSIEHTGAIDFNDSEVADTEHGLIHYEHEQEQVRVESHQPHRMPQGVPSETTC